ncbi:hypothetical protein ACOSQ4_033154 [Xanthoceras sorbifolium]
MTVQWVPTPTLSNVHGRTANSSQTKRIFHHVRKMFSLSKSKATTKKEPVESQERVKEKLPRVLCLGVLQTELCSGKFWLLLNKIQ